MKKKQRKRTPVASPAKTSAAVKNPQTSGIKNVYFVISLLTVTFVAFYPCIRNDFTNWDDPTYIIKNLLIRDLSFSGITRIFSQVYYGNYQPLHILLYTFEYHFFKLVPTGYHLVSVAMHVLNAGLVFRVFQLLSGKNMYAFLAALLFALHPLRVESVAWASEQKDLLFAFFFFLSLIAYLRYIHRDRDKKFYLLTLLFFVLSALSKAMAVSFPLVIIALDYFYKRKMTRQLILEKLPFFLLAFVFGIISIKAAQSSNSIQAMDAYPFWNRVLFASHNYLSYIAKIMVPHSLSAFYPYPDNIHGTFHWSYYVTPLGVIGLLSLVIYSLRHTRKGMFAFLYFSFTIFFILQFLPVGPAIMAERYTYLPALAFSFLFMELFYFLYEKYTKGRMWLYTGVAAYCLFLFIFTWNRCSVWKTSFTLWDDVVKKHANAVLGFINRGDANYNNGKFAEAEADFSRAVQLDPRQELAWYGRGTLYARLGKLDLALKDFNTTITLKPDYAEAYNNRGSTHALLGNLPAAFADYAKALALKPDFGECYFNMGITFYNAGQRDRVCEALKNAVALHYEKASLAYADLCKDGSMPKIP